MVGGICSLCGCRSASGEIELRSQWRFEDGGVPSRALIIMISVERAAKPNRRGTRRSWLVQVCLSPNMLLLESTRHPELPEASRAWLCFHAKRHQFGSCQDFTRLSTARPQIAIGFTCSFGLNGPYILGPGLQLEPLCHESLTLQHGRTIGRLAPSPGMRACSLRKQRHLGAHLSRC